MTDADFEFIAALIKKESGIIIAKGKEYLLESRLMPIVRANSFVTLEDLFMSLRSNPKSALINQVVDAMTTNESFFFRDVKPFTQFENVVLPYILKEKAKTGQKTLRIWSAAASSGQEAYSLAMLIKEKANLFMGWKIEIIGTDISTEILNKAMAGVYSQFEVQRGLPIQLLVKYFKKDGDAWLIDSSIKSMVQFKKWNLLDDLSALGFFDVVFCRNVLIYFDQPTKSSILEKIRRLLPDDGFLYLGGAETVLGICDKFRGISGQRGIYICNTKKADLIDEHVKKCATISNIVSPLSTTASIQPKPIVTTPPPSASPAPTAQANPASATATAAPAASGGSTANNANTANLLNIMKNLQTKATANAPQSGAATSVASSGSASSSATADAQKLSAAMAALQNLMNKTGTKPATSPTPSSPATPTSPQQNSTGKPAMTMQQIFAALKEKQDALRNISNGQDKTQSDKK